MKTLSEIIDTKDKKAWSEYLEQRKKENQKRPLMARGYSDEFGEDHPTYEWHTTIK